MCQVIVFNISFPQRSIYYFSHYSGFVHYEEIVMIAVLFEADAVPKHQARYDLLPVD